MRGFVPDLYLTLAACDVAIVQGGLTTWMELAAAQRPFLFVPLENHFEQNFHVRRRLDGTGRGAASAIGGSDAEALGCEAREEVGERCGTGPSRLTALRGPRRCWRS